MSPPREQQSSDTPQSAHALRELVTSRGGQTDPPRRAFRRPTESETRPGDRILTAEDVFALIGPPSTGFEAPPAADREAPLRPEPIHLEELPHFDTPATRPRKVSDRRAKRRDGVAPFVRPSGRRSRRKRRRDYRKLGFIELTQERTRLRHRILPRTVLGVSTMILSLGVGAAFAGAALYAYYDYRLTQNESSIGAVLKGFDTEFTSAVQEVQKLRDDSITSINKSLQPLQSSIDDVNANVALRTTAGASTYLVRTTDTSGRPSLGSAFVVSSANGESLLLTAYEVIAASTANPGPVIMLEKNNEQFAVELWAWDPTRNLALLRVGRDGLTPLPWASDTTEASAANKRIYAVSGLGGAGATVATGALQDQSQAGLRHDIPMALDFRGGPLVTSSGEVLGVATTTYRPLGFDSSAMPFAPPIRSACEKVLVCPDAVKNGLASPGQQPPGAPPGAAAAAPAGAAAVPAAPTTTAKR